MSISLYFARLILFYKLYLNLWLVLSFSLLTVLKCIPFSHDFVFKCLSQSYSTFRYTLWNKLLTQPSQMRSKGLKLKVIYIYNNGPIIAWLSFWLGGARMLSIYCVRIFAVNNISVLPEQTCALQKWKCLTLTVLIDQKLNKHTKRTKLCFSHICICNCSHTECVEVCSLW